MDKKCNCKLCRKIRSNLITYLMNKFGYLTIHQTAASRTTGQGSLSLNPLFARVSDKKLADWEL